MTRKEIMSKALDIYHSLEMEYNMEDSDAAKIAVAIEAVYLEGAMAMGKIAEGKDPNPLMFFVWLARVKADMEAGK